MKTKTTNDGDSKGDVTQTKINWNQLRVRAAKRTSKNNKTFFLSTHALFMTVAVSELYFPMFNVEVENGSSKVRNDSIHDKVIIHG